MSSKNIQISSKGTQLIAESLQKLEGLREVAQMSDTCYRNKR